MKSEPTSIEKLEKVLNSEHLIEKFGKGQLTKQLKNSLKKDLPKKDKYSLPLVDTIGRTYYSKQHFTKNQ